MTELVTYREAINSALVEEMRRDPSVFVYGIDVADHKRIFGSTAGLLEEFGEKRCFSTPLSEEGMTGFGLGAAINGLRPIHVHMRVDFMILAMNQITNMIASYRYGSCGKLQVPMVIRAVVGRGWGQAWQHSKTLHSWFAHIPGLRVVMPSNAKDAKGMLTSAIRNNDPVIFIEHRWLYDVEGGTPEDNEVISLESCAVVRPGDDVTVLAVSWMNVEALKAADILARHGVSVEIVDVRSISPFDIDTVVVSVEKTGHLVVADYDWLHCGFSAEVAAQVYDRCRLNLKSGIRRLGFPLAHCPTSRPLEDEYYVNAIDIIRSIEDQLGLDKVSLEGEEFYSYENKFKGPF